MEFKESAPTFVTNTHFASVGDVHGGDAGFGVCVGLREREPELSHCQISKTWASWLWYLTKNQASSKSSVVPVLWALEAAAREGVHDGFFSWARSLTFLALWLFSRLFMVVE